MVGSESPRKNSHRDAYDFVASPLTKTDTSALPPKFQTSIAPVSSAEFRTQLELLIADEEALPTTQVIKKAEAAVEWLKAIESPLRFLICPWSPEKRADYAKLLETMLQFSQMSRGRRYTACAIYLSYREGTTNDAKINNLTALSLMWMAYLVYPFVNYGEFRSTSDEYRPVSSSNIPCFDDVTEQITSDRTYICEMTDFEKLLLERDGFRCVGSKTPSLNKGGLKENKKIPSALTTGTHILPMMVSDYKAKDAGSERPRSVMAVQVGKNSVTFLGVRVNLLRLKIFWVPGNITERAHFFFILELLGCHNAVIR
ncbi:hypothetical protein BDN70DRAFT_953031 [Pholiota conissans]|uniref:Uncharacterized protein n=1 Tax=Pholiota conissans TaxID=109636 RepID=A0A9P5YXZ0_9AGAR|nr:hypothetical protein BDN70DRAFT_953031 [Pholiota conissans]